MTKLILSLCFAGVAYGQLSSIPSASGSGGSGTVTSIVGGTGLTGGTVTTTGTFAVQTTLIPQKFFGTAAPGSVATNLPGDLFTDTTNHNEYVCNAPSGTAAPACTSVATAGWLQLNGAGGNALTSNPLSQFAATTSAQLAGVISDETGTGAVVLATSPTLVTPLLGTPTSGTLTNATGLPISTGVSGLATGVATLLGTPSSANLATALTDETGTGAAVFGTSPTLVAPALGTPASGVMTNVTGLPLTTGVTGVLPLANMTQEFQTNAQTATYQVLAADFADCKTIPVASGTFTITLVASGSQPATGQCIDVINYGSGVVTLARSGQNINGAASNLTGVAGSASNPTGWHVVSDGTNYIVRVLSPSGVTSVATTGPITGGTITATGTIACATCAVTGTGLNQFAPTTSAQFAGVISDPTGTGAVVLAGSPTLTGTVTAPIYNATTAASGYQISGTSVVFQAGNYLDFSSLTTNAKIRLGNVSDPTTYFTNTAFAFQDLSAAGLGVIWKDGIGAQPGTFGNLTACNAGGEEGYGKPITDSTTDVRGATITGGGTKHVLAYCDGTNWTVDSVSTAGNHSDQVTQAAALTSTALYTPAATSLYRVSYYAKVTRAATTSSILGGTTGFVLNYTDGTDSVAQTLTLPGESQAGAQITIASGNTGNATTSVYHGTAVVYAKTAVAMTYNFGYSSTGATTMQYEIHVMVEGL